MTLNDLLVGLGIWTEGLYSPISLDTEVIIRRYHDDYSTSRFDNEVASAYIGADSHTGKSIVVIEEVEN